MNFREYESRRCPSCHHLRCGPECPENDDPDEDEEFDEDDSDIEPDDDDFEP